MTPAPCPLGRGVLRFGVSALLLSIAAPAAAQTAAFAEALAAFVEASNGAFGDEGPRLIAAVDALARAPAPSRVPSDPSAGLVLPLARYAGAYARLVDGRYADGVALLRAALEHDPLVRGAPAAAPALQAGSAALRAGRAGEAQRQFAALVTASPDSSEAHRLLGLAHWVGGGPALGVAHLERAAHLDPENERARLALARVLSDSGRGDEATRSLEATLAALPQSAQARWWLSQEYERVQRTSEARRLLAEIDSTAVLAGRGRLLVAMARLARLEADFAGASAALARRAALAPDDGAARRDLAAALLAEGRIEEAEGELLAAIRLDATDALAHAELGRLRLDGGRAVEAVAALRRALALDARLLDARYTLAAALRQAGRDDEAARELEAFARAQRAQLEARRREMAREVREEAEALGAAGADAGGALEEDAPR